MATYSLTNSIAGCFIEVTCTAVVVTEYINGLADWLWVKNTLAADIEVINVDEGNVALA